MPRPRRVLVVDDDDATLALFRKILAGDNWEVEASNSASGAAAKLQPGQYSLVVSDIYMPEMNGMEFYDAVVKADPELRRRFLFVSGYTDSSAVKTFLLETGCPGVRKPIRVDEFRELAAHVALEKPITAAELPARWFTPDSQYLYSGEIAGRHTLFALLNRIYAARLTGVLHLLLGRVEKRLYFNLGHLIFATSNVPEDGLGELLLQAGALTQSQFEEATARMQSDQRFGYALVDMGICDMDQLGEWVRQQVTRIAASIFRYSTGRYYFYDSFEENVVPEVGIAVPLGRLLLEAVREAPDLPLDDLLHDDDLRVDLAPDPVLRFQAVELDEAERMVLISLTQPMRAAELLQAVPLARPAAARALYALLALGCAVAVSSREGEAAAAPFAPGAAEAEAPAGEPEPTEQEFQKEVEERLAAAEKETYYKLLGLNPKATTEQIRNRYYTLARRYHPDRHMGRSEWIGSLQTLMDALTLAYRTLEDEKTRATYDLQLAQASQAAAPKSERTETAEECLAKAQECLRGRNYAGSIVWLRKCTEIAPDKAKYRAMLARSLAAVPQYRKEAMEQFEKAVQLDPWNTSVFLQYGDLLVEMQLHWRARPIYEKILEIDPEHPKARERLRALNVKEGKKDDSQSFLGRLFSRKAR